MYMIKNNQGQKKKLRIKFDSFHPNYLPMVVIFEGWFLVAKMEYSGKIVYLQKYVDQCRNRKYGKYRSEEDSLSGCFFISTIFICI